MIDTISSDSHLDSIDDDTKIEELNNKFDEFSL